MLCYAKQGWSCGYVDLSSFEAAAVDPPIRCTEGPSVAEVDFLRGSSAEFGTWFSPPSDAGARGRSARSLGGSV
jgi:hypothetical protein